VRADQAHARQKRHDKAQLLLLPLRNRLHHFVEAQGGSLLQRSGSPAQRSGVKAAPHRHIICFYLSEAGRSLIMH